MALTVAVATVPCYAAPDDSDNFVAISAGGSFATALTSTGNVWTWGYTYFGIQNGSTTEYTPVKVRISQVKAIASGFDGSIALKDDGTVWAWGNNNAGQLGDGTNAPSLTPVEVKGLANVVAIAPGHICWYALKDDGTVWAWGANWNGQLGDGSMNNSPVPVQISGLSDIVAIGTGGPYAIGTDGSAWAWGDNTIAKSANGNKTYGALGDDYQGMRTPFRMKNLSNVKAITSSDGYVSYAVENNGLLWAWGLNDKGLLGNGMSLPETYLDIPPCVMLTKVKLEDVVAVSAGDTNAMALKSDGTVWVWGAQLDGQVYLAPTQVNGLDNVNTISAGSGFYVALKNDGTVWTWGSNNLGALGDGKDKTVESYRGTPMKILGSGTAHMQTAAVKAPYPTSGTVIGNTVTPTAITTGSANASATPYPTSGFDFGLIGLASLVMIICIVCYRWIGR